MATAGEAVIAVALKYLGAHEVPDGSNEDGGPISRWQKRVGLHGEPWCGTAEDAWFEEAGVDDSGICSPSTALMCQRADDRGGLAPTGLIPPGSAIVKCGIHTGLVVHDRGNGILDTVEGNVSNQVARRVRAREDWRVIVFPAIAADIAPPPPVFRDAFGFDDLIVKPKLWGGWRSAEKRDAKMAEFKRARPGQWVRPVKVNALAPYAFWSGPEGTFGKPWSFGGWRTPVVRASKVRKYQGEHAMAAIRLWHKRVPVPAAVAPAGGVSGDESLV